MGASPSVLRLGTRGSLLARTQSQLVADQLARRHPGLRVDLVTVQTTGDRVTDRPLHDVGGKGLFTKELELALLAGEIDFAVHSYKDVPVTMPLVDTADLVIAAVPKREDPRDVAAMREPGRGVFPPGARVGTSSLRRRCQVMDIAAGIEVLPLRGNIDTRLRKLRGGGYDVILLAMAGLSRVGLFDRSYMTPLDPASMLPAAAQGALALQCRRDDRRTRDLLAALDDANAAACVAAERAVVAALNGDCHSPIAALAEIDSARGEMSLRSAVGGRGGAPPVVRASARGKVKEAPRLVEQVVGALLAGGATPGGGPGT